MTGVSRRDLIRWSLLGGGVAPIAAAVAACSDAPSAAPEIATTGTVATATTATTVPPTTISTSTTASSAPATTAPATTAPIDPSRPWWMQANYAPVTAEVGADALVIRGAIPPELTGQYVRNGSNPANGDSPHWFFGDGMVHGVRFDRGKATAYRNRYVNTTLLQQGAGFGEGAPGGASNQSNVSAIWHANRLLTSGEVGLPYQLSPDDLSTTGPFDFGGALTSAFTAHPKIDPVTGRLHSFGYGFTPPYLTYHVTEPDGTMAHVENIDLPASVMMHDFAITERDAIFWDLPVVFDLDLAIQFIADPTAGAFPYQWKPDAGARIGVMPLEGGAAALRWFELDPCYVFHGVNAFRRGDEVVLDVCRLSSMFAPGELLGGDASLRRWTLNTATGATNDEILVDTDPGDLPSRDPRRMGRDYRYAYLAATRENPDTVEFGGLVKHDFTTNTRETWDPGPTSHGGEWLFVPVGDGEDEGYLLGFVHDDATAHTELVIIDATDVTAGPVAFIEIPQRVPYGFHATWIPA